MAARAAWVPDRQDIIWIDCNPQVGSEMRDIHPMLVLSPRAFNGRTGLVIGLPFDWRLRRAKPHPLKRMGEQPFAESGAVLNQIIAIG